jgi:hypothetical protein
MKAKRIPRESPIGTAEELKTRGLLSSAAPDTLTPSAEIR